MAVNRCKVIVGFEVTGKQINSFVKTIIIIYIEVDI